MNTNHIISKRVDDIKEIRQEYNIVDDYVKNTLPFRKNGFGRYHLKDVPETDKQKMVQMYLDGYNTYTIGKAFDMSYKQIVTVLDMYNIPRIYSGGSRKYTLDEHFFDVIDNEDKVYILGLLYADGTVNSKYNLIQISLQEDDLELLEEVNRRLGSNKPLQLIHYEYAKDRYGLNMKNQYRLTLSSSIMKQALINLGCVPKKSKILEFPNIPKELYPHFIRGYFDGDGSIFKGVAKNRTSDNYRIDLVGTYDFLLPIQKYLKEKLGISGGGIYPHHSTPEIYNLSFSGKQQTKKIADLLYDNATIFMKRKHDRYIDYYYTNNSSAA